MIRQTPEIGEDISADRRKRLDEIGFVWREK
jgi:hypothetical protein